MRLVLVLLGAAVVMTATAGAKLPPPPTEATIVPTGPGPCGMASSAGGLWIGVYESGTVLHLEQDGRVTRRIAVGRFACRIAVDARFIWVTRDNADEVVRVNRRTGGLRRIEVGAVPFDVLRTDGAVWVTEWENGTVTKIDPARGAPIRSIRVRARPTGLAECGGRIWVGHGRDARQITSIDPMSLNVRETPVAAMPEWPHCIRGELWVTSPDSVLRLDPRTGRTLTRLRVQDTLADAALAPDGLVWVTDKQHSVVHRVRSNGRSVVDSFPAGRGAFAVARLGSSMWVTSFAGSDVRRFDP